MTRQQLPTSLVRDHITGLSVSVLIVATTLYVPLLGFFLATLLPMPVVYYRLKLGRNQGAILAALVFGVVTAVTGAMTIDMMFYGGLLFTGFLLGELIELNLSIERTCLYICLGTIGIVLVGLALFSLTNQRSFIEMITAYVAANLELTLSLYKEMGMPQETIETIAGSLDTVNYILVRILPALCTVFILFVTWVNVLFIKAVLQKRGITLSQLTGLTKWRAPDKLVWCVIGTGLVMVLQVKGLSLIGLNCIIVLMLIYFFQGIAIVSFFFEKKNFPRILRIFIYSIIALQQLFLFLVVGLGFFDTWINFRKIGVTETRDDL